MEPAATSAFGEDGVAKLAVIRGQTDQREFLLGDETVLGRSPDCEVTIPGPFSSRQHARITHADGSYYIEDLGSANGTVVNGFDVARAELQDGDWISIGDCQLTFLLDENYVPPQEALLLDDAMPTVVDLLDVEEPVGREETGDSSVAASLKARLDVLKQVAERSCGALEIGRLVELTLDELLQVYRQADHAHAVLPGFAEGGEELRLSVTRAGSEPAHVGMSRTLLSLATDQRKAVLAGDVRSDDQLRRAQSIVDQDLRSMMCSPVMMGARVLGALQVDTTDAMAPFSVDDLQLLVTIAGQVAVAAENSRLHQEVVAQQRLAAVGQAVSSIAHCIKNALNGLQGGSYILDVGLRKQDQDKVAKGWEMVKRNASFMSDMVRDMLAYCRKSAPRREPTDIGELLNETVLMVRESAAQNGVQVSLEVDAEAPAVAIDATGIKRVVLNLLTNAIEACSDAGRVNVTAQVIEGGRLLRIAVADDGPGLPAAVKEHLFEPFFTTKGSRGTGLGLPLVKKVVEEHHGRVEVQSEPGQGTAFYISIPTEWDEEETVLR